MLLCVSSFSDYRKVSSGQDPLELQHYRPASAFIVASALETHTSIVLNLPVLIMLHGSLLILLALALWLRPFLLIIPPIVPCRRAITLDRAHQSSSSAAIPRVTPRYTSAIARSLFLRCVSCLKFSIWRPSHALSVIALSPAHFGFNRGKLLDANLTYFKTCEGRGKTIR